MYQISRIRGVEQTFVKHLYSLTDRAALALALEGVSGPTFLGRRPGSKGLGGWGGPASLSFF